MQLAALRSLTPMTMMWSLWANAAGKSVMLHVGRLQYLSIRVTTSPMKRPT